jgi:glycosyltransferase involved in cell wall biosynthesis
MINVIITTHNRPNYLENCLKHLCKQDIELSAYKIIVIDSYSETKDENVRVIKKIEDEYSIEIMYFYNEDKLGGLTKSRNIAVKLCEYELIIQADDDSLPSQTYISSALKSFNQYDTDLLIGRMTPLYESIPSKDLISSLKCIYNNGYYISDFTVIDLGTGDCIIPSRLAFGSNCAFKKSFYLNSGGFGPDGYSNKLFYWNGNGEHNYTSKAKKIYYIGNMHAEHCISTKRLLPSFFHSRSRYYGVNESFNLIRGGSRPVFSVYFIYTLIKKLFQIFRSCLRLNLFAMTRTWNNLLGFVTHQYYCFKSPILYSFCKQPSWENYNFVNITEFKTASDQWTLLAEKKKNFD